MFLLIGAPSFSAVGTCRCSLEYWAASLAPPTRCQQPARPLVVITKNLSRLGHPWLRTSHQEALRWKLTLGFRKGADQTRRAICASVSVSGPFTCRRVLLKQTAVPEYDRVRHFILSAGGTQETETRQPQSPCSWLLIGLRSLGEGAGDTWELFSKKQKSGFPRKFKLNRKD